jgi:hypothetical protein
MSTEQSLDPQLVEQTKQQIRSLVAEIARLAKSDVGPQEFYAEFLPRVVSALAAIGGVVWTTEEEGRLALAYQVNVQRTGLLENEEAQRQHSHLLQRAFSAGEPMLVPPHSGAGEEEQGANPTEFLLVFGPLKTDLETVGVVEIFQRPEAGVNTQKGYLRFLNQMCDLAADFIKSRQLRHFSDRQVLWTRLEEFTRVVHASLEPRETAYTIANEGRRLIECDRVSVAIRRGGKANIEAVSGQDLFDKRSNTVRLLGKLASAVVATGDPVWYSGDTRDLPPQVEKAVQDYVDESHTKTIAVLPLKRPRPEQEEEEVAADRPPEEPPLGALIVEQIEDSRIPETMLQRIDVVSRHSSASLANALEHDSLFLMPLWRTLGKAKWLVRARTLPKTVAVAAAIVAVFVALAVVPADFELEAKGTLEPVDRSDVFARTDGVVKEILVEHGDEVNKGQVLARLRNTDLEVAIRDIVGQMATTREQILTTQRTLLQSRLRPDQQSRLEGELLGLRQKIESLRAQHALYMDKREDLEVPSPRKGQIITWDVRNRLIHRPVQRGQVLMRVADPSGPWQLELHMAEDRMGHIVQAQKDMGDDLEVTYILATEPGEERTGEIAEVHLNAEVRGDEGNTVLIKVAIDQDELPELLRPGATVTGKIDCGKRAVGYVWFHDLIAFIQSRILFRL